MAFTKVVGAGIHTQSNINSHNIHSTGIITATRFDGPFTNLNVTGVTTFAGDVSIGGTLTYEDVTNIDSVGLITARNGLIVTGVSTFQDIDVDGHTNLDNVSIVGVATLTASGSGTGKLRIEGATQGQKIHLHRASTSTVAIRYQNNHGSLYAGLGDGFGSDQRFVIGKSGTLSNDPILQASEQYNVIVGTGITFSGSNGNATFTGIVTATSFKLANGSDVGTGAGGTWSTYTAGIATTKSVGVNTNNLDDNDLVGVGNSFQGLYISNGMMITDNKLSGNHYIGTAFNGLMAGPVNIEGTLTIDGNYVVV